MFKNLKINLKILILFITTIIIMSIIISISSLIIARNNTNILIEERLLNKLKSDINATEFYIKKYYGNLELKNNSLIGDKIGDISNKSEMVDKLFDELGNIATIFVVDGDDYKRIVTNIINERGERAVGTSLGKDSSAYPYIRRGEVYLGPAKILNKNYYTIYKPIKNQENRIIGVVFLGVERTHADELLNNTILNMAKATIIIVLIFTCIISILIVYFLRKIIVNPILEVVAFGKEIGELDLLIDYLI